MVVTMGQPKASGLVLVRTPLLTNRKWRELVPSGRLVCRCHDVFLWCYVCFALLRFRLYAFVEAAALRSIVLRYAGAPIATPVSFSFLEMSLFSSIFLYHFRFLFKRRVYVLCVFFPFILDIKFVGRTSRGHTGERSHRISHPPSFCGACLNFSREKDSAIPFPCRP